MSHFSLSGEAMLRILERGRDQHPLDRAITILSSIFPRQSWEELASLSIGKRDAALLSIREESFGPRLSGFCGCSTCRAPLEFDVNIPDIRHSSEHDDDRSPKLYKMEAGQYTLCYRLPNSLDLGAVVGAEGVDAARDLLVSRCVLKAHVGGHPTPAGALPSEVVHVLSDQMAQQDPQAEVILNLHCPACGHAGALLLDIGLLLWMEIAAQAKRLIGEVHLLARAYGWREADILAMGAYRRQLYLERVT
jgi:hypothetical protein